MRAVAVANGLVGDDAVLIEALVHADHVIAIDGGMRHLIRIGHKPQLWVGDMDSSSPQEMPEGWFQSIEQLQLPIHKDASDSEIALEYLLDLEMKQIQLFGMLGGRIDHILFNLKLLKRAHKRCDDVSICEGHQEIRFLKEGELALRGLGRTVSVVPLTPLEGVTITGCRYGLNKARLASDASVGLSNVIEEEDAKLVIKKGEALVIFSQGE